MSRSSDERTRLRYAVSHLRAAADSVETAMRLGGPIGTDVAQSIETAAANVARGIAKVDAFFLAELDATEKRSTERP
jgi:hypothetical protein